MIDWSPLRQASLLRIIDTSRKAPQLDSLLELVLEDVATSTAGDGTAAYYGTEGGRLVRVPHL